MRRANCVPRAEWTSLPADPPGGIVLLTRPLADSRRVAAALAAHGIATAIWPLTRIVPAPGPIAIAPGTTGLVFTSQNAVEAFAGLSPDRTLRAWCVGDRTADAARRAGFANVVSAAGDVQALAGKLAALAPTRLLYLRGDHVSTDLGALLDGTGHTLDSQVVYTAQAGDPPGPDIAALLARGQIGTIAVWSRRAAQFLARAVAKNTAWQTARITLVAISNRAAGPLREHGFARISIPDRPDGPAMEQAILAAVRQ